MVSKLSLPVVHLLLLLLITLALIAVRASPAGAGRHKRDIPAAEAHAPDRISPVQIFDLSEETNTTTSTSSTTTTSANESANLLSKMLMSNMDESVRPIEM